MSDTPLIEGGILNTPQSPKQYLKERYEKIAAFKIFLEKNLGNVYVEVTNHPEIQSVQITKVAVCISYKLNPEAIEEVQIKPSTSKNITRYLVKNLEITLEDLQNAQVLPQILRKEIKDEEKENL